MRSRNEFNLILSLVLSVLVLLSFVSFVNAQKNDPSVPMDVAEDYKNDYEFEDALEWYEKVIQDFPDTVAAGNACLNRLAILLSQRGWHGTLYLDFLKLFAAQTEEIGKYGKDFETSHRLDGLDFKKNLHLMLELQKGMALRKEFYRFEKKYASKLDKLSPPYINKYEGEMPSIAHMKEDDVKNILILKKESQLEYESRKQYLLFSDFFVFSLRFMILGGEESTNQDRILYYNRKYNNQREINSMGFYYWLGIALFNSYQFESSHKAFTKVINLSQNISYSKLAYESNKWLKKIERSSSKKIKKIKDRQTDAEVVFLSNIDKYVEPYTEDSEK